MRGLIIVLILWGFGGLLIGQSSYKNRIKKAKSSSEDRSVQINPLEAILYDDDINGYPDTVGSINYAIAFRYRILGKHLRVIDYSTAAIRNFETAKNHNYQFPFSLSFLGESYAAINQDKESIDSYFRIMDIEPEGRALDVYGYAVNEVAIKFIQYEDYESAIAVIDQFLTSTYRDKIPKIDLVRILLSSSIAHSNLNESVHLISAQDNIEEAERLYNLIEEDSDLWISIDMQKAAMSLFMNEPHASTLYQELLDKLSAADTRSDYYSEARTMLAFNASYALQKNGDFSSGLEMAKTAKNEFGYFGNSDHIESEYLIYNNLATAYFGLSRLDSAHYYIDKGLELFPPISEVTPANRKHLLNLLYDQARISYAQRDEEKGALTSALNALHQLDQLMDMHIAEQVSGYSVNNLKDLGLKYYQLAIDISYALYDQKSFWHFSEKAKGLQLLKSHAQRRVALEDGGQQSIIDSLKRAVVILETELQQNSNIPSAVIELKKKITKRRSQIITLQREVFDTEVSIDPYDLATMIDVLDRKELVLQYQYGSEDLYLQVVSNAGSVLKRVGNSDSINTAILNMRKLISNVEESITKIEGATSELHNSLINEYLSDRTELFVIPDRELFFLPFEVLRANPTDPYLIEEYDVSYLPSGSFKSISIDRDDVEMISIYKPNYENGANSYAPLPFIDKEINSIDAVFDIELIKSNDDTNTFFESLSSSKVVHFGGHAIVDGHNNEQSYLALGMTSATESRLRLGELYTIGCGSELVTLSACNTGMGGILDGEGVSSITRGFLYAGARSVVNTLWTVDDQSTSTIVGLFYKYLSQGKSQSHALRMAKLEYLNEAESYQRHPYYWAGIIGMGDMSHPIVYPTDWTKVFLTIIMVVLITWFLTWRFNDTPMRKIEFLSDWEELVNDRKIK